MPITVVHHDSPDPADVPPSGWAGSVVTVIAGKVTGEIIRSIYDGGTIAHEAHIAIDGHDVIADVDIQVDDPQTLRDLAAVAGALADELAK